MRRKKTKLEKFLHGVKISLVTALSVLSVFLVSFSSPLAQMYQGSMSVDEIFNPDIRLQASLSRALNNYQIAGLADQRAIHVFYAEKEHNLQWVTDDVLNTRGEALLTALGESWTHGLNPDRYHYSQLMNILERGRYRDVAYFDLLMTDGFMRYVRDLSGMRVGTKGLRVDPDSWRKPIEVGAALELLRSNKSVEEMVNEAQPKSRVYQKLRQELMRLASLSHDPLDEVEPLSFGKILFPGERHARIPDLRERLGVKAQTNDPYLYDDRLTAAIIKFQRENNLKDDGLLGTDTLQILNRTRGARIRQVVANLERLRWLNEDRPDKYVLVNIPATTLWAIDNGSVKFEMPVIVGKRYRPTVSFKAEITGVRLNPTWTVPSRIKYQDILPKLKRDPSYLDTKGIELWKGYGRNAESIDPSTINWKTISWGELQKIRMVQIPGDHNALGRVRVLMQNPYDIYMHDTNHRELFTEEYRALSSGCVRLSDPMRMANFIMHGEQGWSKEKMQTILDTEKKTDVEIEKSIPVYLLYQTMWLDDAGRVVYGPDIYNQDKKLIAKLADIDGFAIPEHNNSVITASAKANLNTVTR